jgi:hypothetical protein
MQSGLEPSELRLDTAVVRSVRSFMSVAVLVGVTLAASAASSSAGTAARSCRPSAWRRCQLDVLGTSAIAGLKFGASHATARTVIDALLHQPGGVTQKSGSCRVESQITWQDQWTASGEPSLTLYFSRAGLVGYQAGAPQEPRRPPGGWMLATSRGLHVGSTLGSGRQLYGSAIALSASQGGVWLIRSPAAKLDGYASASTPGRSDVNWRSLVATIDAGDVGCPAVTP